MTTEGGGVIAGQRVQGVGAEDGGLQGGAHAGTGGFFALDRNLRRTGRRRSVQRARQRDGPVPVDPLAQPFGQAGACGRDVEVAEPREAPDEGGGRDGHPGLR